MPDLNPRPHTSRVFYGWYILIGYFFLLFFQAGARHSFGVMFKPMIAQLSWNRASISLAFGFTLLITAPLTVTLVGRLYGFTHIGLLSGFITTIHHFGGGFWAYMGGLIFDKTGSYQLIFILSAVLASIAMVCTVFIREERHVRKMPKMH